MPLDTYYLLGRTGLRVSPLGLGTMTFGDADWHAAGSEKTRIFHRYLERGGNFVDTADIYAGGASEEILGELIEKARCRDRIVLATKFGGPVDPTDPNARGNGRKHVLNALDASLRRLRTDHIDLYWLHLWDQLTPPEEVMATFDALVRSGKVRAVGLSDVPAWWATKAQLVADRHGWEPIAALQLEYSLVQRSIEWEHVPAALDLGMDVVAWSPLANGYLTGKYAQNREGRLTPGRSWPMAAAQHDPAILDAVVIAADRAGCDPAQVALNWVAGRPGVVSTLVGATSVEQLDTNLDALDVALPDDTVAALDRASYRTPQLFPHNLFAGFAANNTRRRPPWRPASYV
ncbi:aldo/keto reductase [Cryptosporangium sp. NPDC048952]|uniref:aldo/keto reductase n=1 Tax=Cryptosporangium sp. NPDC048952 TaxID=3363961 RepID=UPI00371D58AB